MYAYTTILGLVALFNLAVGNVLIGAALVALAWAVLLCGVIADIRRTRRRVAAIVRGDEV